jgi:stage IV sporulation protein FB
MFSIPGRIPIKIFPFFWLLAAIIGWVNSGTLTGTAIWVVVIVISVLVHEYGHALTALAFGQQAHIDLVGMGGVTHREGPHLSLWKEFIIVLNGPAAGFLLFLIANYMRLRLGDHPPDTLWTYTILIATWANLFWTIVNLLPIHPLDGGKLLSIILESIFGMSGVKFSLIISSVLSILIALVFFYFGGLLAGSLFFLLAFESYRAWRSSLSMSIEDKNESLQDELKQIEEDIRIGNQVIAKEKLLQVRDKAKKGMIYNLATEYLAGILNNQRNYQEAYDILKPIQNKLSPEGLRLLHQLSFRIGEIKDALKLGDSSYQAFPNYDTALINSLCYSLEGQVQPAVGWLQRAISDGLPNCRVVFDKTEFDPIRNSEQFQNIVKKYL